MAQPRKLLYPNGVAEERFIGARVSPVLKDRFTELVALQGLTISDVARQLFEEYVEKSTQKLSA